MKTEPEILTHRYRQRERTKKDEDEKRNETRRPAAGPRALNQAMVYEPKLYRSS
jgi:hypothetical protein